MKNILILNGSLGGNKGNTEQVLKVTRENLKTFKNIQFNEIQLIENHSMEELANHLKRADGFIFASGTYWDSWGSPMQRFLENATEFEGSDLFFKKPASVIITMHSVGGKEILSRLQGVLVTMGLFIPPMSGLVYGLSTHLALKNESSFAVDFWSLEDIEIINHNLITAMNMTNEYKTWPFDIKDPKRRWL